MNHSFIYFLIHLTIIDSREAQFWKPWINIIENEGPGTHNLKENNGI